MKQIKFQAWDRKQKKMLIWDEIKSERVLLGGDSFFKTLDVFDNDFLDLLQFTGFIDVNKKESYHKNICKYKDDYGKTQTGIIIKHISGGWELCAINGDDEGNQNVMLWERDFNFEIIGNVYENPELLNKDCNNQNCANKKK